MTLRAHSAPRTDTYSAKDTLSEQFYSIVFIIVDSSADYNPHPRRAQSSPDSHSATGNQKHGAVSPGRPVQRIRAAPHSVPIQVAASLHQEKDGLHALGISGNAGANPGVYQGLPVSFIWKATFLFV